MNCNMPSSAPMHARSTYESILLEAGIRITAVRLLVLKTIIEQMHGGAFSLQDIMEKMVTADNSSVFRTLTLLAEKRLLHTIDDGSGMQKYCLCTCPGHDHRHGHVHFTCTSCQKTICLMDMPIPHIALPEGFEARDMEFIVKGLCPKCASK